MSRSPLLGALLMVVGCDGLGGAPDKGGLVDTDRVRDTDPESDVPVESDTPTDSETGAGGDSDTGESDPPVDTFTPVSCTPGSYRVATTPRRWDLPTASTLPSETFDGIGYEVPCPGDATRQTSFGVLDLTGDGLPDLVVTDDCGTLPEDRIAVYPGTGKGFATTPRLLSTPDTRSYTKAANRRLHVDGRTGLEIEVDCPSGGSRPTVGRLADLDGDGILDLLFHDRCHGSTLDPTPAWWVYLGSAAGWTDAGAAWLPPGLPDGMPDQAVSFADKNLYACDDSAQGFAWDLLDLDGDGRSSLVIQDACDAGDVGTTRWIAYTYDRGGQHTARDWTLAPMPGLHPTSRAASQTTGLSKAACASGSYHTYADFTLADMTGDGVPDFVQTASCTSSAIVGVSTWLVYPATPTGFASTPIDWDLPAPPGMKVANRWFSKPANIGLAMCESGVEGYFLVRDADGDGFSDIVFPLPCDAPPSGPEGLQLYLGRADGMGAKETGVQALLPTDPVGPPALSPRQLAGRPVPCDGGGEAAWTWQDLDGDGRLDVVVTDVCDVGGVGTTHWLVYRGVCATP